MSLESKHINLLRSCAKWLHVRALAHSTTEHTASTMLTYATDLSGVADILQSMDVKETVVTLEDLFEGKHQWPKFMWHAQGEANQYVVVRGKDWFAHVQMTGTMSDAEQEHHMIQLVKSFNDGPCQNPQTEG